MPTKPAQGSIYERIAAVYPSLSDALKTFADYVVARPVEVARKSIQSASLEAGVSVASANRLARILGYSGYGEFRAELNSQLREGLRTGPALEEATQPGCDQCRHLRSVTYAGYSQHRSDARPAIRRFLRTCRRHGLGCQATSRRWFLSRVLFSCLACVQSGPALRQYPCNCEFGRRSRRGSTVVSLRCHRPCYRYCLPTILPRDHRAVSTGKGQRYPRPRHYGQSALTARFDCRCRTLCSCAVNDRADL